MKGVIRKKVIPKKHRAFFDFQGNKFTKPARDYHYELLRLTGDLIAANRRVQESSCLCHQQINFFNKNSGHLIPNSEPSCFKDALYHLENFTFRVTGYRDKLVQFVNQALRIGFDEKSMGVLGPIVNNRTVRDSHIDTEIKRFDKDKDFKQVLSDRVLMTHRRYYQIETGYNPLMMPREEAKNPRDNPRLWKQNIQTKASRADRIVLKAMEMNDRVMVKINSYLKKTPY